MGNDKFTFRSHPADFEILYSAIKNCTSEMGITMERTARSPIYYSSHDFATAVFDKEANMIALSEYLPVLLFSTPFAVRAARKYFGDDIHPGDIMLLNDPYTLDGGNHLPDWTVMVPVFYKGELWFWSANMAHQMDIGGGQPGAYNPNARDVFAEGVRIPPIKIFERGELRRDVFDFVLANTRFPEAQRGDLLSMIGAARTGERRLLGLLDSWGEETMEKFLLDMQDYSELLMREEIAKIPDGTYYGEAFTDERPGIMPAATIRCNLTVKGNNMVVDLTQSDPLAPYYVNSTIANTYSSVFLGLMTSVGRPIKYRSAGCMRPVEIRTKPGTITHATFPAPVVLCTLFIADQIISAVWDALSKVAPEKTPAGWGALGEFVFSGIDPRRNEFYATPDFLASGCGAGAIWGTDGWHSHGPTIMSGAGSGCFPEIEVCEATYPALWKKWECATDSQGPGRWCGGTGAESTFILEADQMMLNQQGDHFNTIPNPVIAGGKRPPHYNRQLITRADGTTEEGGGAMYILRRGDTLACYCQGGCGVGDPLDREVESVRQDVIDEFVSLESARDIFGVVINPKTLEVDGEATKKLRLEKRQQSKQ